MAVGHLIVYDDPLKNTTHPEGTEVRGEGVGGGIQIDSTVTTQFALPVVHR